MRRRLSLWTACIVLAVLAGCGGSSSDRASVTVAGAPAGSAVTVASPAPSLAEVGSLAVTIEPGAAASASAASRYLVDVVDPESLEPVHPAQAVERRGSASLRVVLDGVLRGNWRLRVRAVDAAGRMVGVAHSFVTVSSVATSATVGAADLLSPTSPEVPAPYPFAAPVHVPDKAALDQIDYFIIVYMENQSYDGVFPYFKHANGIEYAGQRAVQRQLYTSGPPAPPIDGYVYYNVSASPDPRQVAGSAIGAVPTSQYPVRAAAGPWNLGTVCSTGQKSGNVIHQFVNEQRQINRGPDGVGRMDQFAAWADNPALVQSYYDSSKIAKSALFKYAQEGVLCDAFFHSAYGDTWLNEFWFISGASPIRYARTDELINLAAVSPADPTLGYATAIVHEAYELLQFPKYPKTPEPTPSPEYMQTHATIGDRLDSAGISWKWYGSADYEINPFMWFRNYAYGTPGFAAHFDASSPLDGGGFVRDVEASKPGDVKLKHVSFVRPLLDQSLHPDVATYDAGQTFLSSVVEPVLNHPEIWDHCAIIITFDENGGRWDHVPPPPQAPDGLGPGTRVPTIVLSPFARVGTVDHKVYETVSILKTLQLRWGLAPLTARVDAAADLSGAFEVKQKRP